MPGKNPVNRTSSLARLIEDMRSENERRFSEFENKIERKFADFQTELKSINSARTSDSNFLSGMSQWRESTESRIEALTNKLHQSETAVNNLEKHHNEDIHAVKMAALEERQRHTEALNALKQKIAWYAGAAVGASTVVGFIIDRLKLL